MREFIEKKQFESYLNKFKQLSELVNMQQQTIELLKTEIEELKMNKIGKDDLIPIDSIVREKDWKRVVSTHQDFLNRLFDNNGYERSPRLGYEIDEKVMKNDI